MRGSRLERLLHMPGDEMAGRATMLVRQHADRWTWAWSRPVWNRASLARRLDDRVPAIQQAARQLRRADAAGAHATLSAHFAGRASRFVLAPRDRDRLSGLIRSRFPDAEADARRRGALILSGRLDVLGYQDVSFASDDSPADIDWHRDPVHDRRAPLAHWSRVPFLDPAVGDHKVVWELNRHQHWMALGRAYWLTGDTAFRRGFMAQLASWMAANPPRTGVNWASMLELGFRSLSWIWALHLFVEPPAADDEGAAAEPPWTVDLLLGLQTQLDLVHRHLSTWFSPNTHLLGEGLALYVAGRALPELRDAAAWERTGRALLVGEIARQVHADGGHVELSPHYHRYTLDFYLLALAVARRTNDLAAATAFAHAARRLASFAHVIADAHDRLPQLGDDDGGQLLPWSGREARDVGPSLALAAELLDEPDLSRRVAHEEVVWVAGALPRLATRAPRRSSAWLPDSGYVVMHTPRGDHLVMDVGRLGFRNAGHAHADALSLTLSVAGRPLLIDPGTGCYTIDPEVRDRLRSTAFHNTVTVDRRSQSEPAGPFHWHSQARASLALRHAWPDAEYVEASHDGYGPAGHCRQVLARPGCWVVVDWIGGTGVRHAAAHWHLDPSWAVTYTDSGRVGLQHRSGAAMWLLTLADRIEAHTADRQSGLGWHAPVYGPLHPTTTLRATRSSAVPFPLVTAVVEGHVPPTLHDLGPGPDAAAVPLVSAFRLSASDWTDEVQAMAPASRQEVGEEPRPAPLRFRCVRRRRGAVVASWDVGEPAGPAAASPVSLQPLLAPGL